MSSAAETTVIELGLLEPESQPEPAPSAWWRSWWRRHRGRMRQWAPAAVVVALLLPLSGAAGAVEPALRLLWMVPGVAGLPHSWSFTTDETQLYLAAAGHLTAFDLADGRVNWQAPLEDAGEGFQMQVPSAGLLTVGAWGPDPYVQAYEVGTGELRWSHPGAVFRAWEHGLVMLGGGFGGPGRQPVYVDYETGDVQRTLIPEGWDGSFGTREWGSSPRGSAVFSLAQDGALTRYALDPGTTVATVDTPHAEPELDSRYNRLWVRDEVVLVSEHDGTSAVALSAYDATTLTHRWSGPDGARPEECHSLVCLAVGDEQQEQVQAVDPVTGKTRWTIRCADLGVRRCPAVFVQELPGDRMWLSVEGVAGSRAEPSRSWLVDAGTGEPLTAGIGWDFRGTAGDGLLLSRAAGSDRMRTWWARSDANVEQIEVLGVVEAEHCYPQYPYLICSTSDRETAVWRVGPEA